jgi:hypothetical protein
LEVDLGHELLGRERRLILRVDGGLALTGGLGLSGGQGTDGEQGKKAAGLHGPGAHYRYN